MRSYIQCFFLCCYGIFCSLNLLNAQLKDCLIDVTETGTTLPVHLLPFEGSSPNGEKLAVNNLYFLKNGKPWLPVMGEIHYTRVPENDWEQAIRKMKAGGISTIATYVFWNEHEIRQGVFDWTKRRNLREFIRLCQKNGVYVWLRIGPWCHGEQLNGGHPEWIHQMKGKRSNDPVYLKAAQGLFVEIGKQARGLFFKDGGPVIGVQLENEYASGDPDHIHELKKIATGAGIQPVYWSITANTVFRDKELEVIPLQGSYPYRGWEKNGGKATKDFLYGNDQWIMSDALGRLYYDVNLFPRGLCEQGCGSQMTYANRFTVEPHIVEAHLQNQLGRGMNLIGYYMFHGGTQTPGLKEPGHPESYDFQSPVGEFGIIRPSYHNLKIIHHFLRDFGSDLAAMRVIEPKNPVRNELDSQSVRFVAREHNNSGFVFFCNAQVRVSMPDKMVNLSVKLKDETIQFPPFLLKGQTSPILPFNLAAGGILIKYATAQPLARLENGNRTTLVFSALPGVEARFKLDSKTRNVTQELILKPGESRLLQSINNNQLELVLLSGDQALQSWRVNKAGKELLLISSANLQENERGLEWRQVNNPLLKISVLPAGQISSIVNFPGFRVKSKNGFDEFSQAQPVIRHSIKHTGTGSNEVVFSTPGKLRMGISDWLVTLKYLGDSGVLYYKDSLISDHLNHGQEWKFYLKAMPPEKSLTIKIKGQENTPAGKTGQVTLFDVQPEYFFPVFFKKD